MRALHSSANNEDIIMNVLTFLPAHENPSYSSLVPVGMRLAISAVNGRISVEIPPRFQVSITADKNEFLHTESW
jgi:hypothetical protein